MGNNLIPTVMQRRVAEEIIKGEERFAGAILEKAGYSKTMQTATPSRVMESTGVKKALADLGMSEDVAAGVVREIMTNKDAPPSARLTATDQTFKVHGTYAPTRTESVSLEIDLDALKELQGVSDALARTMREGEAS